MNPQTAWGRVFFRKNRTPDPVLQSKIQPGGMLARGMPARQTGAPANQRFAGSKRTGYGDESLEVRGGSFMAVRGLLPGCGSRQRSVHGRSALDDRARRT